jgi:hypothetical protein
MGFAQVAISYELLDNIAREEVASRSPEIPLDDAELVVIRAVPYLKLLVLVYKHPNFKAQWQEDVQALPSLLEMERGEC